MFFLSSLSWVSPRGMLVVFLNALGPAGASHDSPNRALQTPPKFHERTPKRGEKERKMWREGNKREILAPHTSGPTLRAPTLRLRGPFVQEVLGTRLFLANLDIDSELQHVFWWELTNVATLEYFTLTVFSFVFVERCFSCLAWVHRTLHVDDSF